MRPQSCDHDIVDELDVAELGVDRDVRGVGAVGVGVLLVEEGAFGRDAVGESSFSAIDLPPGPTALVAFDDLDLGGRAAEPLAAACARIASRRLLAASSIAEPPITIERE